MYWGIAEHTRVYIVFSGIKCPFWSVVAARSIAWILTKYIQQNYSLLYLFIIYILATSCVSRIYFNFFFNEKCFLFNVCRVSMCCDAAAMYRCVHSHTTHYFYFSHLSFHRIFLKLFFSFSASSVWLWIVVFPSKWLKDVQESQSVCKHRERSCAKSDSKGHHADHWLPPRLAHALKRADMAAKEIHHSGQRDWIKAPRKAVARKGKMKGKKNVSSHFLLIMICYFNNWIIITFFTSSGFLVGFLNSCSDEYDSGRKESFSSQVCRQ